MQDFPGLADRYLAGTGGSPEQTGHHVLEVHVELFHSSRSEDLEPGVGRRLGLDLHHPVFELACLELAAHRLATPLPRRGLLGPGLGGKLRDPSLDLLRGEQQVEQTLLGRLLRPRPHLLASLLPDHLDGDLDQVADHRLDVAADVADLGELRRLDLEERRTCETGQTPGDLGLADTGGPDHQDVLG